MASSPSVQAKDKTFTSKKELVEFCQLPDIETYNEWRAGPLFAEYFDELYQNVIKPQQEEAKQSGQAARKRLMNLVSVETAILEGERHGRRKYSGRRPQKASWTPLDHYAYAMYQLREDNTHDFKGIFYSKRSMTDHEKHQILWAILQFEVYEMAPSRVKKREEAAKRKEAVAEKRRAIHQGGSDYAKKQKLDAATTTSDATTQETIEKPSSNILPSQQISITGSLPTSTIPEVAPTEADLMTLEPLVDPRAASPNGHQPTSSLPLTGSAGQVDLDNLLASLESETGEGIERPSPVGSDSELDESDHVALNEARNLLSDNATAELTEETLQHVQDTIDRLEIDQHTREQLRRVQSYKLSDNDIMMIERRSETFDLNDRYWQYDLLKRLHQGFKDVQSLQDTVRVLNTMSTELNAEDAAWRRSLLDDGSEEADNLLTQMATEEDRNRYLGSQLLVDNIMFQPQGHAAACAELMIPNPERPRFPSMPLRRTFHFWQVVAIHWMICKRISGLGGVLVCDTMGMGKTWELAGMLLAVSPTVPRSVFQGSLLRVVYLT